MRTVMTLIRQGGCPGWSVFTERTCHFVGFVMRWLIFHLSVMSNKGKILWEHMQTAKVQMSLHICSVLTKPYAVPSFALAYCLHKCHSCDTRVSSRPRQNFSQKTTYSRTLMAWTSLGLWKSVWDMSSSSHWGLIMMPGQEANSNILMKAFQFSTQ